MNRSFLLYFGIFAIMALSNALVPVLPDLDADLGDQALIFSSYFLGAMLLTLPTGILSERVGQPVLILSSLVITVVSGAGIILSPGGWFLIVTRLIEGFGAGVFVSASLSWITYQPGHARQTGYFMASMNAGLLFGLAGTGWLVTTVNRIYTGIWVFTLLTAVILVLMILMPPAQTGRTGPVPAALLGRDLAGMMLSQAPLWVSVIVLIGITGFVQAVFPDLSGLTAGEIGTALAVMNLASIIASLLTPRLRLEPVLLIRLSALVMSILTLVFLTFPLSIFLMGGIAGLITVSQITYLATAERHQGLAMGLYTTFSYAGMTLIPAIGGYLTDTFSLAAASAIIAAVAVIIAVIIGRCRCRGVIPEYND